MKKMNLLIALTLISKITLGETFICPDVDIQLVSPASEYGTGHGGVMTPGHGRSTLASIRELQIDKDQLLASLQFSTPNYKERKFTFSCYKSRLYISCSYDNQLLIPAVNFFGVM